MASAQLVHSLRVAGQSVPASFQLYRDEAFAVTKQQTPNKIVLHESVTHDPDVADNDGAGDDTTERILRRKGYGTHFMVGFEDAMFEVSQHNDTSEQLIHAGKLNTDSVAIEVINPYCLQNGKVPAPWTESIKATWAWKGVCVIPTFAQCVGTFMLVRDLCRALAIPFTVVGKDSKGRVRMSAMAKTGPWTTPGIWAHAYYPAHADGLFSALFLAHCEPLFTLADDSYDMLVLARAYAATVESATKAKQWATVISY